MSKGTHGLFILVWDHGYLWHDVPGTALIQPSFNVISTELRVSNGTNAREYLLSKVWW